MLGRTGIVHLKPQAVQTKRIRNTDDSSVGGMIEEKKRNKIEKEQKYTAKIDHFDITRDGNKAKKQGWSEEYIRQRDRQERVQVIDQFIRSILRMVGFADGRADEATEIDR